jgi:bifunctional hydroxylase/dehydrase
VSSFSDATRQVGAYRRGRVLLAGDAAHIHLPAGGQGLSTGVQDAVNLGWKLAATVRGTAPAGLLDTYHGERHPVGRRLLMNTRAQGIVFLGGEQSDPLRLLFAELVEHDAVRKHLAGVVSHLDIRYDVETSEEPDAAEVSGGSGGAGRDAAPAHPLLGRRLVRRPLAGPDGETDTYRLLHPARGVLLDLADDAKVRGTATPWADRVDVVRAAAKPVEGTTDVLAGLAAVLVRPDGHVVWTSDGSPHGLAGALGRWFGDGRAA